MRVVFITALAFCLCASLAAAGLPKAPPALRPDDRFKADILVIVAHPVTSQNCVRSHVITLQRVHNGDGDRPAAGLR
jgi:hypothetical protein